MAILLTYPEDKFDDEMLIELYNWQPLFLPLKRIQYLSWNDHQYQLVKQSQTILVTNILAVQALIKSDISLDKSIIVVSPTALKLLQSFHFNNVLLVQADNQLQLSQRLNGIFAKRDKIVYLKGNFEASINSNVQITEIEVYQDTWTKADETKAIDKIAEADFTKVLITSPAQFYRFESIEEKIPQQFMAAKYYTIDPATKRIMEDLGFQTYLPRHKRNILKQAVWKITREK